MGKEIKRDENEEGCEILESNWKGALKQQPKKKWEQAMPIYGEGNLKPGKGKCKALKHTEDLGNPFGAVGVKQIVKSMS